MLNKQELLKFLELNLDDELSATDFLLHVVDNNDGSIAVTGTINNAAACKFLTAMMLQSAALAHGVPGNLVTKEQVLKTNRTTLKSLMDNFEAFRRIK